MLASVARTDKTKEAVAAMARLREVQPNGSIAWIEPHVPYSERALPYFPEGTRKTRLT